MDARIAELVARLTGLERERADIVAEIDALRSARSEETAAIKVVSSGEAGDPIDHNSAREKKIALFRRLFRGQCRFWPAWLRNAALAISQLVTRYWVCAICFPVSLRDSQATK
ncbi:MAG TPA: hypothetical protein VGO49_19535 [Bradyrhizobium sp.]|nr:hypothetical protein [Bradyrhizobium sp.]